MTASLLITVSPFFIVFGFCAAMLVSAFIASRAQKRSERLSTVNYPRCGKCGYQLTGHEEVLESEQGRCPECGQLFSDLRPVLPGVAHPKILAQRRARAQMTIALLVSGCLSYLLSRNFAVTWQNVFCLACAILMPLLALREWLRTRE